MWVSDNEAALKGQVSRLRSQYDRVLDILGDPELRQELAELLGADCELTRDEVAELLVEVGEREDLPHERAGRVPAAVPRFSHGSLRRGAALSRL